jgi:hypothetical protein
MDRNTEALDRNTKAQGGADADEDGTDSTNKD